MEAFIRGAEESSLFAQAYYGFEQLNYVNHTFYSTSELLDLFEEFFEYNSDPSELVVIGYPKDIATALNMLDYKPLKQINYPYELKSFLYRNIYEKTLSQLPKTYPYFIKPTGAKSFSGRVVQSQKDLIGITQGTYYVTNTILPYMPEFRCYIYEGTIFGVKQYKGDPFVRPNQTVIHNMVSSYTQAPKAYTLDVGVTPEGNTILIEVNNGITSGNYGLSDKDYAIFLQKSFEALR